MKKDYSAKKYFKNNRKLTMLEGGFLLGIGFIVWCAMLAGAVFLALYGPAYVSDYWNTEYSGVSSTPTVSYEEQVRRDCATACSANYGESATVVVRSIGYERWECECMPGSYDGWIMEYGLTYD